MVSINHDSALTPRSLRDTTYEYVCFGFCSGSGTVIGLDIGVIAGALPLLPTISF